MAGDPAAEDRAQTLAERVIACAPGVVLVVDERGLVQWVGGALEALSGYRPDEVVGHDVAEFLHSSSLPAAFDAFGVALVGTGLQRPLLCRVVRRDGTTFSAEVQATSGWDDPVVRGLVLFVRRCDERVLLDRVIECLAAGAELGETFGVLTEIMGAETLEADGAVLWEPRGGRFTRRAAAPALPDDLVDEDGPAGVPWHTTAERDGPSWWPVDRLPTAVARRARAAGYATCWCWPVPGPDGPDACLVLWRRRADTPDPAATGVLENLARVTALVLAGRRADSRLHHAATHDDLTDLANRSHFSAVLGRALETGGGPLVGVLAIDLDDFKPVNDRLGHRAGDLVLFTVGRRLQSEVRHGDLVARTGGDEFAIVCDAVAHASVLEAIAERVADAVAQPIAVGGDVIRVGISVGIASAEPGRCTIDALMEAADTALYAAKAAGRGAWRRIDPPPGGGAGPPVPS